MVARPKTCRGTRAFADVLTLIQADCPRRDVFQRPRQCGSRLSLRRSAYATTSAIQQPSTSSESTIPSTDICERSAARHPTNRLPNKQPPLDPRYRQRANAFHKPTSTPNVSITEAEKGPTSLSDLIYQTSFWNRLNGPAQESTTSKPVESTHRSQLLKQHFLDDWLLRKAKKEGWVFTWSFISSDKPPSGWFNYHLSHYSMKEDWTVSAWGETEEQARMKAYPRIFSRIYGILDWGGNSATELSDYLVCLKLMLDDRLVFTIERERTQRPGWLWFTGPVLIPEMEKTLFLKTRLFEDKQTRPIPPSSVIRKVVNLLREKGVWESLLSQPQLPGLTEELVSELKPGDPIPPKWTDPETMDASRPLTQQSIERLLKDFFQVRRSWSERFHDEMAAVQIHTTVYANEEGIKTCHAVCSNGLSESIETKVVLEPFKPISRSQLESMAIALLLPKLARSGMWDLFLEGENVPPLFLSDDLVWRMEVARSEFLKILNAVHRAKDQQQDLIQVISRRMQRRLVESSMRTKEIKTRSEELTGLLKRLEQSTDLNIMAVQSARAELSVSKMRDPILNMINQHTYCIVSAQTGSGKSTQIPQIILDDAIRTGGGGECRVLCVQPRRVAAQLLGTRVAVERNESIGETVGYSTRFGHKPPVRDGSITYCTAGVLLKMFGDDHKRLQSFTHIMLDEVHVRGMEIDFIMLLLKRYVDQCRSNGTREPRIVITSATVDLDLFSSYFRNIGPDGTLSPAPSLSISGRQYDVKQHYLDDILDDLTTSFEPEVLSKLLTGDEVGKFLNRHYQNHGDIETPETPESTASNYLTESSTTPPILEEDALVPFGLISALVFHLLATTESGSILIFLPGFYWIEELHRKLLSSAEGLDVDLSNDDQFRILRLHSELGDEMEKLTEPLPRGCRRILLSTDIAEASITLPDVSYVIDSGRINDKIHDSATLANRLACRWASKSNLIQRAGRVGRIQNGEYFFLGTKRRYDSLKLTVSPAIKRGDLSTLCLRAKSIVPDVPIWEVLQQAVEPPSHDKVLHTIESLKALQALSDNESITKLGILLSQVALSPKAAKLVVLGIIFRCLDPLLVLALVEDTGSLFPPVKGDLQRMRRIRQIKQHFAAESQSDHIAQINAFIAIREMDKEGLAWDYTASNLLQMHVYLESQKIAGPVLSSLNRLRMIEWGESKCLDPFGGPNLNVNSNNVSLLKALITHCSSGRVASPHPTRSEALVTSIGSRTYYGMTSIAKTRGHQLRQLLAYSSKKRTNPNVFAVSDSSAVTPFTAYLFGGKPVWDGEMVRLGSWLPLQLKIEDGCTKDQAARSIIDFRELFHRCLRDAYSTMLARKWIGSYDQNHRKHRDYWRSSRWSMRFLSEILPDILALDATRSPTSQAIESKWNAWQTTTEDIADQDETLSVEEDQKMSQDDKTL